MWLDHGAGLISYYAHLDSNHILVSEGQAVSQGQVLALSDNSGYPYCSSGPHLHFAMHSGATSWNNGSPYMPEPMAAPYPTGTYTGFGAYGANSGIASPPYTAAISPIEYRPSAVSWGSLRMDLFIRGGDNGIWHRYTSDDINWPGNWENLGSAGGGFTGEPATATWMPGRLDVFAIGYDGNLWHKWWDGTSWQPTSSPGWQNIGCGGVTGTPSAAAYATNGLMVIARGTDRTTRTCQWNGAQWVSGSIGGYTATDPDVISAATNSAEVFILGGDNAVWHAEWAPNQWSGFQSWGSQGGGFVSQPTATYLNGNQIDVFAVSANGYLWDKRYNGTWGSWQPLTGSGGPTTIVGSPSGTEWPSGGLFSVIVRDANGALWDCWPVPATSYACSWQAHQGILTSDPLVLSAQSYGEDLFARAGSGWNFSVAHQVYNGSWNPAMNNYDNFGGTMT